LYCVPARPPPAPCLRERIVQRANADPDCRNHAERERDADGGAPVLMSSASYSRHGRRRDARNRLGAAARRPRCWPHSRKHGHRSDSVPRPEDVVARSAWQIRERAPIGRPAAGQLNAWPLPLSSGAARGGSLSQTREPEEAAQARRARPHARISPKGARS
jgi:hypothetical protein